MADAKTVKLLLAEDNDGHAWLLADLFRRAGIINELVRFRDGQEAWEYLSSGAARADAYVLLLDIRMPRMDGIELLRLIKSSQRLTDEVPVIIITSSDDPKEMAQCLELGCAAFLNKPLKLDNLVLALKDLGLALIISDMKNSGAAHPPA